jgi:HrpA-like RNA helicase
MSASLNADLLSRYFDSAPLTHVNGRTFPVQKRFLSEIRQLTQSFGNRINTTSLKPMVDQDLLVKLVRYIDINKPSQGSILVFLPGWAEIKNLHSKLKVFTVKFRLVLHPTIIFHNNAGILSERRDSLDFTSAF